MCDAKPSDRLPNKLSAKHKDTNKESLPFSIVIFLIYNIQNDSIKKQFPHQIRKV